MKPIDLDTVSETEIPHGGVSTGRQNTNHGIVVLPNLQLDFVAVCPKQCGPQYVEWPGGQSSEDRDYMQQSQTQACYAK